MMRRIGAVVAIATLALMSGGAATAEPADHCPGANPNAPALGDYTIVLDNDTTEAYPQEDRNDTILPAGTLVCVKGGLAGATGIVEADGEQSLFDILGSGQDVSYYMTYTLVTPTPTPTPTTSSPTPTPTTSSPEPTKTPKSDKPEPSKDPKPTPEPKQPELPATGGEAWLAGLAALLMASGGGLYWWTRRA